MVFRAEELDFYLKTDLRPHAQVEILFFRLFNVTPPKTPCSAQEQTLLRGG